MVLSAAPSRRSNPSRAGLVAAAQWVGVEVGVALLGAILVLALSIPLMSGTAFIIERGASIVALLLLALHFHRRARRDDLNWGDLGYHQLTRPVIVAGLIAGALLFLIVAEVTSPLDSFLFPRGAKVGAEFLRRVGEGGLAGAVLLLLGNGLLAPIVEEYAWRGYIQNKLTEGIGLRFGVVLTALLFAAKHIVADVSLFRTMTLLVAAFALGLIRIRWGTTTTTIAHAVLNFVATSFVIAHGFG